MNTKAQQAGDWLVLVSLALTLMVLWPLPGSYFFGDDLLLLYDVANKPLADLLIVPYGGHLFTTRNLVAIALYSSVGPAAPVYFTLVLLTHLANVILLFVVIRGWTDSARLACFGAALWGAAPVHSTSLAWFQNYGQVLVVTGLLLILWRIERSRRFGTVSRAELVLWGALLIVMSTSHGLGIPVALALPAAAFLLLPPGALRTRIVIALAGIAVGAALLYFGAVRLSAWVYPRSGSMPGLSVAIQYWQSVVDLAYRMLAFGLGTLLSGPLAHSLPIGGFAVVMLVALCGLPALRTRDGRCQILAWVLLAVACYATIAAGRVAFYYKFRDTLIQAARYQYVALVPMTILLCAVLAPCGRWRYARQLGSAALATWIVVFAFLYETAGPRFDRREAERQLADEALAAMRGLVTRVPAGEPAYLANQPFLGVGPFVIANPANFPGWAALFVVYSEGNELDGRPLYFVEANPAVLARAKAGKRSATLLIAPTEVPPSQVLKP